MDAEEKLEAFRRDLSVLAGGATFGRPDLSYILLRRTENEGLRRLILQDSKTLEDIIILVENETNLTVTLNILASLTLLVATPRDVNTFIRDKTKPSWRHEEEGHVTELHLAYQVFAKDLVRNMTAHADRLVGRIHWYLNEVASNRARLGRKKLLARACATSGIEIIALLCLSDMEPGMSIPSHNSLPALFQHLFEIPREEAKSTILFRAIELTFKILNKSQHEESMKTFSYTFTSLLQEVTGESCRCSGETSVGFENKSSKLRRMFCRTCGGLLSDNNINGGVAAGPKDFILTRIVMRILRSARNTSVANQWGQNGEPTAPASTHLPSPLSLSSSNHNITLEVPVHYLEQIPILVPILLQSYIALTSSTFSPTIVDAAPKMLRPNYEGESDDSRLSCTLRELLLQDLQEELSRHFLRHRHVCQLLKFLLEREVPTQIDPQGKGPT